MEKKFCLDLTAEDCRSWCEAAGFPKYRADQLFKWLSTGVISADEMTNLPKEMKAKLAEDFYLEEGMQIIHEFVSKIDGTVKLVYKLHDGHIVETVIMRYKPGLSICISSQAGCKMGCSFCARASISSLVSAESRLKNTELTRSNRS